MSLALLPLATLEASAVRPPRRRRAAVSAVASLRRRPVRPPPPPLCASNPRHRTVLGAGCAAKRPLPLGRSPDNDGRPGRLVCAAAAAMQPPTAGRPWEYPLLVIAAYGGWGRTPPSPSYATACRLRSRVEGGRPPGCSPPPPFPHPARRRTDSLTVRAGGAPPDLPGGGGCRREGEERDPPLRSPPTGALSIPPLHPTMHQTNTLDFPGYYQRSPCEIPIGADFGRIREDGRPGDE